MRKTSSYFDEKLGQLLPLLCKGDLLFITADHGNDPTHTGTDHTRERVPLLCWAPGMEGRRLPDRSTFGDLGATVCAAFGLGLPEGCVGTPILEISGPGEI